MPKIGLYCCHVKAVFVDLVVAYFTTLMTLYLSFKRPKWEVNSQKNQKGNAFTFDYKFNIFTATAGAM